MECCNYGYFVILRLQSVEKLRAAGTAAQCYTHFDLRYRLGRSQLLWEQGFENTQIDALARRGMKLENAYLTTSSFSPSRSRIITGRYPHNAGAAELYDTLPDR